MTMRPPAPRLGATARLTVASGFLVIARRLAPGGGSGYLDVVACAAILIFGMPHGALDLERLRCRGASKLTAVLVYVGCGFGMYGLWLWHPPLALAAFLAFSVMHFAEDWSICRPRILRIGLALAIVSAPAVLHGPSVARIFEALTGCLAAGDLARLLTAIAPAAMGVALLGILNLVKSGATGEARSAAVSLIVMVLFPPIQAFALFFCLAHSPLALTEVMASLGHRRLRDALPVIIPMTIAALGIVAILLWRSAGQQLGVRWLSATFISLSVLTVPHMLAPALLTSFARSRGSGGRTGTRLRKVR